MKRVTKIAIAGAALLAIGAATIAAQASDGWRGQGGGFHSAYGHGGGYGGGHRGGKGGHGGRMAMMMQYFDSNGDGAVSREEIEQVRTERFAAFDADGDSALTLAEFEGLWLDFMRERMVDGFQRFDADGDGRITAAEIDRPLAMMMQRMDRNEDGVIDRSDFKRRGMRSNRDDDSDDDS